MFYSHKYLAHSADGFSLGNTHPCGMLLPTLPELIYESQIAL